MSKKLYKSTKDKMIAGVCGGIAEYFDVDSSIIRIVAAILILLWGSGLILYIICACILPKDIDIKK